MEARIKRRVAEILVAILLCVVWVPPAYAACVSPTGSAGDMRYNSSFSTPEYCNGASWVAMRPTGDTRTGLSHYWKLDETSGTSASDSVGGATATLNGAAAFTTSGELNGALDTGSANDADVAAAPANILGQSQLTVSAWIKLHTTGSYVAIGQQNATGGDTVAIEVWGGGAYFGLSTPGAYNGGAATLSSTTWNLYTMVFDGTQTGDANRLRGYIDGAPVTLDFSSSPGIPATTTPNALGFGLGSLGNGGGDGVIDDARVYNRALSAQDVKALYNSTGPLSGDINTGLIHNWKLDEAPGATMAVDAIGGANVTLAGSAAFATGGQVNNDLYLPNDSTAKGSGVTTPADMLGKSALTMALWLRRACAGCVVESGQELFSNGEEIAIQAWTDGNIYVDIGATGSGTEAYAQVASDDTAWHHVALVFDGTQTGNSNRLNVYLDGALQTPTFLGVAVPATTSTHADTFYIGAVDLGQENDAGNIDDVRIYNRALSASDVLTLYNSTATACGAPTGYMGDMIYNGVSHVWQYCDGSSWKAMGPILASTGGGCAGPTGSEGDIRYNSDKGYMQYCNGASWIAMGSSYYASQQGLVAWWKLDDGSGPSAADATGNGHTGTLTNGPIWTTSGQVNGALTFAAASSEYVTVPDAASLQLAGSWTVSAWVKLSSLPASGSYYGLVSKSATASNTNYGIYIGNNSTGISCGSTTGWIVDFNTPTNESVCGATTPATGTWYHVAGVWDSVAMIEYLYVNGVLVGSNTSPGQPKHGAGKPLTIGMDSCCVQYADAVIDDARVYNRALSATEIMDLYQATGGQ